MTADEKSDILDIENSELEIARTLSDKDHPIWKFLIMMATILGALWASDSM